MVNAYIVPTVRKATPVVDLLELMISSFSQVHCAANVTLYVDSDSHANMYEAIRSLAVVRIDGDVILALYGLLISGLSRRGKILNTSSTVD